MTSEDDVHTWSTDDVSNWLRRESFEQFVDSFRRWRIDGIALCDLQREKFDSLTRSSMGRDDRASMLWKNINSIKSRAKSRNAFQKRTIPIGPPETPPRDYRTDHRHQDAGEEEDTFEGAQDDDQDDFTDDDDDDVQSEGSEYMEPTEDQKRSVPEVPRRPTNPQWNQQQPTSLSDLQIGLMRKMSERATKTKKPAKQTEDDVYLEPNEEDETYDVPDSDDIYDIPDEPGDTGQPVPASIPLNQQNNRMGNNHQPGPRMPGKNMSQPFHTARDHPHVNDPPAPPIPNRNPNQVEPVEEEEYAIPVEEPEDYIYPEEEESYLEPEVPNHRLLQGRQLPCPPIGGSKPPPRPEKPKPFPGNAVIDIPPAIPSRPQPSGRRQPMETNSAVNGCKKLDKPRTVPLVPNFPQSRPPDPGPRNLNEVRDNENGNSVNHIDKMLRRFEKQDNNNMDEGKRPVLSVKPPGTKTNNITNSQQRLTTPGGNLPRRAGTPASTSSTSSSSSISSSGSGGSDFAPPTSQRRIVKPAIIPDMPPLPKGSSKPSPPMPPQLPTPTPQPPPPQPPKSREPRPPQVPPVNLASRTFQGKARSDLEGYPWFHGNIGRQDSEKSLKQCRKNGAFIVRNSARQDKTNPYSLSLWYNGRVRNLQIRLRDDMKFALGTRKENELAFETASQLIQHHMTNPLILAQDEGKTTLSIAAPVFR